jgi:hypothetical protein
MRSRRGILELDDILAKDRLATQGRDRTVKLWDAVTGQELLTLT